MIEITTVINYENYINEVLQNIIPVFGYFIFIIGLLIIITFSFFIDNNYFLIIGYTISILGFFIGICNLFQNAFL